MIDVRPLRSRAFVDRILTDPAIGPKIAHDDRSPGFIDHPSVSYCGGYVDGRLAAVFTAVQFSRWEVEVHGAVLPVALRHGRALGRLFLDRVFADPDVMRCTAYVLGSLPSAANWVRKLGFTDEGRRREACRVDGVACDVLVLGVTRGEWLAALQQRDDPVELGCDDPEQAAGTTNKQSKNHVIV